MAHVAGGLPVADLGEDARRVRLLRDRAPALPAHRPELGGADVVQEGLQADVAVPHEVHEVVGFGDKSGHLRESGTENDSVNVFGGCKV